MSLVFALLMIFCRLAEHALTRARAAAFALGLFFFTFDPWGQWAFRLYMRVCNDVNALERAAIDCAEWRQRGES